MKSYTDIEQSKKLAEILPLECADMHYVLIDTDEDKYDAGLGKYIGILPHYPCWSLSALLGVMICPNLEEYIEGVWDLITFTDESLKTPIEIQDYENPIDACVEMIIKLHELNLL